MLGLLLTLNSVSAQKVSPFDAEVNEIVSNDDAVNKKNVYLFTGSSSIRMWKDITSYFPQYNVLNRGFGGSQMTDLLHHVDKLIIPYAPEKIFIYEGDNDLAAGKSAEQILASADSLLHVIRTKVSRQVPVAFICAKPSLARWSMKDKYVDFNQKLKAWAATKKNVKFIDVWSPMLAENGNVQSDLFLEDGLHMNKKGYDIWAGVIRKYIK
jgi:lysophospholipase L1-like esterase